MFRAISVLVFAAVLGSVLIGAGDSQAGKLPDSATYVYYIQGKYVGKSTFKLTEEKDIYVFTSTSEIVFNDFDHSFTGRTEIEKETLKLRFFKYDGKRQKQALSGTIWVDGDSVSADNAVGGAHFPSGSKITDSTFLFQDYFSEHQVVMLWAISRAKDPFMRFSILLPTEFMTMPAIATLDSEVEVPTESRAIVCSKYGVSIQNSGVYFLYLDPKRGLPVYMDFPSTQAEGFLESEFGENPPLKYTAPPPTEQ